MPHLTRPDRLSRNRFLKMVVVVAIEGLVRVEEGATHAKNNVVCDALILDPESRSDTYPYIEIMEQDVSIGHEASVSRIGEEQLFYLTSRGLSETEASAMIVNGFIEPLVKELPMEYAGIEPANPAPNGRLGRLNTTDLAVSDITNSYTMMLNRCKSVGTLRKQIK